MVAGVEAANGLVMVWLKPRCSADAKLHGLKPAVSPSYGPLQLLFANLLQVLALCGAGKPSENLNAHTQKSCKEKKSTADTNKQADRQT